MKEGMLHFVVSGAQPIPEMKAGLPQRLALKEIDISKDSIASVLSGVMEQFELAKSSHYVVRRAKVTGVVTSGGHVGLSINLPIVLEAGGKANTERTQGIEVEIERVDSSTD
jgi:hypothetical protein